MVAGLAEALDRSRGRIACSGFRVITRRRFLQAALAASASAGELDICCRSGSMCVLKWQSLACSQLIELVTTWTRTCGLTTEHTKYTKTERNGQEPFSLNKRVISFSVFFRVFRGSDCSLAFLKPFLNSSTHQPTNH
jgi:hypothetical protein